MCYSLELLYLVLPFKLYVPEKKNSYIHCLHFFAYSFFLVNHFGHTDSTLVMKLSYKRPP